MAKQIALSQQKRRNSRNAGLVALVSDEDYDTLRQWNWSAVSTQRRNGGYAMRRDNQSGKTILYKGVTFDRSSGKWVMSFRVLFDSAEEAAQVYDRVARIIYGEHAKTNFPESDTM